MSERDPHHPLNQPAEDPDETEWPDPYDRRADPLGPDAPAGATVHDPEAISTSQPHPREDPEAIPAEEPKRERLDQ
jgi:hypothetical protein